MSNLAKLNEPESTRNMRRVKRFITAVMAAGLLLTSSNASINVLAEETTDLESASLDIGTYVTSEARSAKELTNQARWMSHPKSAHGYAAEEANSFYDNLHGIKSEVTGYDNVKNGADRVIFDRNGSKILIQDKYYSTAARSVDACFDETTGQFRYIDGDGKPMLIEVPADQYDDCVQLMKTKIAEGKVAGVTDINEAENLVKKGNLTYKQAVNLTKAGNIDSLKYDAAHSCVTAATAFGIGTTIDFIIRIHNGEDWSTAAKNSAITGLKTGSKAFAISVITLQLSKTGIVNLFAPGAEALVKVCGKPFAEALLKAYAYNAPGQAANTAAANLLKTQALAQSVTLIVMSVPDIIDVIEGRISAAQMIKNFGVTLTGLVGGTVGYGAGSFVGGSILPGLGNVVGGVIGSVTGGALATYLAELGFDQFIVDDAEKMMAIIETEFCNLGDEYLINEDEAASIADQIGTVFNEDVLKDMYQSKDKNAFAKEKLTVLFDEMNSNRETIHVPTDTEMRYALKDSLEGVVYIH